MRSKKTISAVLFDFDGTLTFPGALNFPAIKQEIGCPADEPILEYLSTLSGKEKKRCERILERKEEIAAKKSFPNAGAESSVSSLKKRGYHLGILTRNGFSALKTAFKNFSRISMDDFDTIITRESARPKPHPEGVFKAAQALGVPTAGLIVVGDFRFDIIAGKNAGAQTVLLTNNGKYAMVDDDPKADFTISQLGELLDICK